MILNHRQVEKADYLQFNLTEKAQCYSVQTARNLWSDDEFCGTLPECKSYAMSNYPAYIARDRNRLQIALIELSPAYIPTKTLKIISLEE